MVIQCKNLINLYILPDQRRVNLLVIPNSIIKVVLLITIKVGFLFVTKFFLFVVPNKNFRQL